MPSRAGLPIGGRASELEPFEGLGGRIAGRLAGLPDALAHPLDELVRLRADLAGVAHQRGDAPVGLGLCKAVALDPNSADAWGNLGQTLARSGQMVEAVAASKRALAIDPNRLGLQSALLFAENYIADSDPFEMADRARAVGALIARKVPARTEHPNDPDPARRLRIGLLSGDLRAHPVGRFLAGVLPELDPARVELFATVGSLGTRCETGA